MGGHAELHVQSPARVSDTVVILSSHVGNCGRRFSALPGSLPDFGEPMEDRNSSANSAGTLACCRMTARRGSTPDEHVRHVHTFDSEAR